ncbi:RNA polymerase sigma factor [Kribbella sp. CA-293567]|uniref:RNA polymerase sigma factor n=1 Tax=Kribbella sp. CA-293567 TaxID=3002436 RepID=UPI0022DE1806|nr:hypothetical protein [Kribbella sp. CA-293567]WBQ08392.1 hypothetical protein OX958_16625 [Kribbella sp. CA-293567]
MTICSDIASYGSLARDGLLPAQAAIDLADHVRSCPSCATYLQQLATTEALLAARAVSEPTAGRSQRQLMALARAADPAHADDLVQETWDHFLSIAPELPTPEQLAAYLDQKLGRHLADDDIELEVWADSLLSHHRHHPSDQLGSGLPPDPGASPDLRELADLDALDADADRADLYFPDFYGDGPDQGRWTSPPTAWPSVTRLLSPDDEAQTKELYAIVDAAIEELPDGTGDLLYLVDLEGHSLEAATSLVELEPSVARRRLTLARNHVRGRVGDYLAGS